MIYKFRISVDGCKPKELFLTESDDNKFYRRAMMTYGVVRENICILAKYRETPHMGYELVESFDDGTKVVEQKDEKKLSKAHDIFNRKLVTNKDNLDTYCDSHKLSQISVSTVDDIFELVKKYKTVKMYNVRTDVRGKYTLVAVYK